MRLFERDVRAAARLRMRFLKFPLAKWPRKARDLRQREKRALPVQIADIMDASDDPPSGQNPTEESEGARQGKK